jgi:diguanylate cyclase (GGDEF)-like protein
MNMRVAIREMPVRHPSLRWVVLGIGIAVAGSSAWFFKAEVEQEARFKFQTEAIDKANAIGLRIRAYSEVLYALRGIFDASQTVSSVEFQRFAGALSLEERYPGLTNISWSFRVPHEEKAAFERRIRAQAAPHGRASTVQFAIKPPGERAEYMVLTYVEPMGKNIAAWGLDLNADPLRRSIVERARDTGGVTSGSGVTLLRDSGSKITSALMRLAVYRGGGVPGSVEERRRLMTGVVGSTVRVGEMTEAVLSKEILSAMRVRVLTSRSGDQENQVLYDSRGDGTTLPKDDFAAYAVNEQVPVGDRHWRIELTPTTDPVDPLDKTLLAAMLAIGLAISVLLFWLMGTLRTVGLRTLELDQRNREAAVLTSLGEDLYSCASMREACEVLAKKMPELIPGTAAVLYTFDASHTHAVSEASWGTGRSVAEEFPADACQAIRRGHAYQVDDSESMLNCSHFTDEPPRSYLCIPLTAQGEVTGLMHVQRTGDAPLPLREMEVQLIKAAAQHLTLALANLALREKLTQRATRDPLTGLYNRHYMHEWLAQELAGAKRRGGGVGVIMLDIDHFKNFNDRLGHQAGDMVLRELSEVVRRVVRSSDVACRQGGEEFLVLMREADANAALRKAEELRQVVAAMNLQYDGKPVGSITISLGVACFPEHGTDVDALIRRADEALYAAKRTGRNRVLLASPVGSALAAA